VSEKKASARLPKDLATGTNVLNPEFWRRGLINSKDGRPKRLVANVLHTLSLHPDWQGVLAWDAFGLAVITRKKPPMRPQDAPHQHEIGDWADEDSARTVAWFASEVGFEPAASHVDQAVAVVARKTIAHPVRDWLSSLVWDGTARLDGFAAKYLGALSSAYSAAVGRRWLIAAVARVFEPGCKVDSLLGLEGEQGIGKSSALRLLAGAEWFADTGIAIGEKDSYQALRRKWIYEFAELSSIRGREIERVKGFLSSQVDTFRASYGRRTQDHPRQVVFAGSTNESQYLADPSGSRRFWPLRCRTIDLVALKCDRDQLWAEARVAYEGGEPWYLDTPELRALAAAVQEERVEVDDWVGLVERWLRAPTRPVSSESREREIVDLESGITTADVLLGALGFVPERVTHAATKRVGHVLRDLGFFPRQLRTPGKWASRERRYFRDATSDTSSASAGSCHTSQNVTGDSTYTQEGAQEQHGSVGAKPVVTSVTRDVEQEGGE
jgi:putative DNA primase/helicase